MKMVMIGVLLGLMMGCATAPLHERMFDIKVGSSGDTVVDELGKPSYFAPAEHISNGEVWSYDLETEGCAVLVVSNTIVSRQCGDKGFGKSQAQRMAACAFPRAEKKPDGC